MKKKVLFLRHFRKANGGHIKVRDYFRHCLEHPKLDPYLYFTSDSAYKTTELWAEIPEHKILKEVSLDQYDVVFVAGGKNWRLLPELPPGMKVINLVQDFDHIDQNSEQFSYLKRPALRICVSQEIEAAVKPFVNGPVHVINNGIPLDLFKRNEKRNETILIWAKKNRTLGKKLYGALSARGLPITLLKNTIPRENFASALGESDIFVALPSKTEGFYLPAIEAMAARCAVVCSDAVGNRSFCIQGQTCLMPEKNDSADHLRMIKKLLVDDPLREKIRQTGFETAVRFSLDYERVQFYTLLDKFLLN